MHLLYLISEKSNDVNIVMLLYSLSCEDRQQIHVHEKKNLKLKLHAEKWYA